MPPQQKQIQVDLTKIKNVSCICGSKFFEKTYVIKDVPGLMVGQTQNTMMPVEIYKCSSCNQIHPRFLQAIREPEPDLKIVS